MFLINSDLNGVHINTFRNHYGFSHDSFQHSVCRSNVLEKIPVNKAMK